MPLARHLLDHFKETTMDRRNHDGNELYKGHDVASLGPSDSSDSGAADMMGLGRLDDTSDRHGTGENLTLADEEVIGESSDLIPRRIVAARNAGLGGGLDQAEEAQFGVTDEELEAGLDDED
jgi:hypothetical protein